MSQTELIKAYRTSISDLNERLELVKGVKDSALRAEEAAAQMHEGILQALEDFNPLRCRPYTEPFAELGFLVLMHLRDISYLGLGIIGDEAYKKYLKDTQGGINDLKEAERLAEKYLPGTNPAPLKPTPPGIRVVNETRGTITQDGVTTKI